MIAGLKLILSHFSQRLLCSWVVFPIGHQCNFANDHGKWENGKNNLGKQCLLGKATYNYIQFHQGFFFVVDFMCFLGNLSCKPFSVSKRTAQEELENIFLVQHKIVNFSNPYFAICRLVPDCCVDVSMFGSMGTLFVFILCPLLFHDRETCIFPSTFLQLVNDSNNSILN